MDYNPANLAPRGVKQGDFFTTTIGPYDYWAIEYAYKPLPADNENEQLAKIASRSAEPQLAYGTDEDNFLGVDPESIPDWLAIISAVISCRRLYRSISYWFPL